MMHVLACEQVRDRLPAYHDGELSLDEQVLIQGHLRDCVPCAIEASELEELGESLRAMTTSLPNALLSAPPELPTAILDRAKVQRQLSFATRVRGMFEDMHFVWAACGATVAALICLIGATSVYQATSTERPDSLAGIITHQASLGSNANPVSAGAWMLLPRPLGTAPALPASEDDAVFAVSAVVTREGRVEQLAVLPGEQARARRVRPDLMLAMLEAASQARFVPAEARGTTVAVSLVWLLASTTVRGRPDLERYLPALPAWSSSSPVSRSGMPADKPRDRKPERVAPVGDAPVLLV